MCLRVFIIFSAFLVFAYGHYAESSTSYKQQVQSASPFLNDNYVCSIQANYGLIAQRRRNSHETTNYCQDTYKTGSCEKCCAMAARLQLTNTEEHEIVGFNIVLKREPLCICCAPNKVH